jgi:hypothetical protein
MYSPAKHQSSLARRIDGRIARSRSDSFDKCYREIEALVTELQSQVHGS